MKNITFRSLNLEAAPERFDLITDKVLLLEQEVAKLRETNRNLLKERNDALNLLTKCQETIIKLKEEKGSLKKQNMKLVMRNGIL